MAYTVTRERQPRKGEKKPVFSYQVKWRTGGTRTGSPQSQTFRTATEAAFFEAAVKLAGEDWPPNFWPKVGWVDPDTYRRWLGEDVHSENPTTTFIDFAADWVNSLSGIQGSTRSRYRRLLALHILPWFGDAAVEDNQAITTRKIGAWINHLQTAEPAPNSDEPRKPLAPKSIRNVHGVLSAILQEATETEPPLRETNPCSRTKLPKSGDDGEGDEEMVFLTPEEFDAIVALMKPDAVPLATILVGTGLRYSEATALQVRDLDLMTERPRLSVWRAWKKQEDGSWELGVPKTPKAVRKVSLTALQVALLLPLIAGKQRKDLVFDGPGGGRWIHQTFFTGRWRPAVYQAVRCAMHQQQDRDAGIARRGYRDLTNDHIVPCGCYGTVEKVPRIHDLRHTQVAWQIRMNQPLAAIQRRLGHKSITTTMDRYGHLLDDIDDEMVVALDALMTRGREAAPVG